MSEPVERRAERWHLKKEIQLTHVISTLLLVGSVFVYVSKVEQRLTVVETQLLAQREATIIQRAQLERMDAKLDRLIERTK
jgi:cell division protein FtsB